MQPQKWITIATISATLLFLAAESASEPDEIVTLPGQPVVSFKQYSGFITIDEKQKKALFYYFVEAETDPALKPLVLWLNGGIQIPSSTSSPKQIQITYFQASMI